MHKIILKWATRVALGLGVAWASTVALVTAQGPEEVVIESRPFIPASPEEPLYDDIFLEYCAYPAKEEAIEVRLLNGEVLYNDPDSCLKEIPEDKIFATVSHKP